MIEELQKNLETEIGILREIASYENKLDEATVPHDRTLIENAIASLSNNLKTINDSVPAILSNVTLAKRLPSTNTKTNLERVQFDGDKSMEVVIRSEDRNRFLEELSIAEALIKRIKKREAVPVEKDQEYKAARGYIKLSNKFFLNTSLDLAKKGYFKPLSVEIKKANLEILFEAYISMMLFSTVIAFGVGIILAIFFLFFNLNMISPYVSAAVIDAKRIFEVILIPILLPIVTFTFLYLYPSSEKSSIAKRVNQELPFAVIHMSAISGSGINPVEIFRIIGLSKEYPFLRKEVRKVLNQINLYGYDLLTALTNVAKNTPSDKLAELFGGLSTTINSGGSLQDFFQKRAETLLLDYRLEREKYTKTAETFMDIYISLVIAAPMVLMVLLILMAAANLAPSFTPLQITILIISIISFINVIFLFMLHSKQPLY